VRRSELQAFFYRALATNVGIDNLREDGSLLDAPDAGRTSATGRRALEYFAFDARVQAQRMGAVYELLYCLENSVRELIETTLNETLGPENWWEQGVSENIRKLAEKREEDDKRAPWHGPRGESMLNYLDFPNLGEIITGRWEDFEDLLGDRTWVENYFKEMNRSRRAIGHTGKLTEFDVERMEMRVREWLRVVG
jgi:Swt1-like HEPN